MTAEPVVREARAHSVVDRRDRSGPTVIAGPPTYDVAVQRVEFTIEPFVEAEPGAHVTAPVDALEALGIAVDVGPFGSSCEVDDERVADAVSVIVGAAIANGATNIQLDVSSVGAPS